MEGLSSPYAIVPTIGGKLTALSRARPFQPARKWNEEVVSPLLVIPRLSKPVNACSAFWYPARSSSVNESFENGKSSMLFDTLLIMSSRLLEDPPFFIIRVV